MSSLSFPPIDLVLVFLFFQPTPFVCFFCCLLSHLLWQMLWLCIFHIAQIHSAADKGLSKAWGIPVFLTNSFHLILRVWFCFPRAFAFQSIEISCLHLWWVSSTHICVKRWKESLSWRARSWFVSRRFSAIQTPEYQQLPCQFVILFPVEFPRQSWFCQGTWISSPFVTFCPLKGNLWARNCWESHCLLIFTTSYLPHTGFCNAGWWFLYVERLSCCSRELPSVEMTYCDRLIQNCLCFPLEKSVVVPNRTGGIIHPYLISVSDLTHGLRTVFLDPWGLPPDQIKTWWRWIFFLEYPNTSGYPKLNHKEVCQMPFQNLFSVDFAIWYLIWWLFWGWKICLTHDLPRSN